MATHVLDAVRMHFEGRVQGIGFRPTLARLALQLQLAGWVRNTVDGVEVHVEGDPDRVAAFVRQAALCHPTNGSVQQVHTSQTACQFISTFQILEGSSSLPLATAVPGDVVACEQCLAEVRDSGDRRRGYWLTSCSQCGPRYTILEAMPYERHATSMRAFNLCETCRNEYTSPADRRFHAQTTCCQTCGPRLTGLDDAVRCLVEGGVLAVKGIGGYQLLVDARRDSAVRRLRARKGRPAKPLAVMVADVEQAKHYCTLNEVELASLKSNAGPIVILERNARSLADSINPSLTSVGLMLPTTPLHAWLVESVGPLVVTSANLESEPIAYRDGDALTKMTLQLADAVIDHDREIQRPIDDSVVRVMHGQAATIRLARGLAPLPLDLRVFKNDTPILAVGGHQKVAIALCNGRQSVLGPHLGDMETVASRKRFIEHVDDWGALYRTSPSVIVHDLHPDYFTTRWAQEQASEKRVRSIAVQHHHAHVVSGMVDKGWLDRTVLGIAWDGTGLGQDGTIWGGEALLATACRFERVASLRPFALPGGEAAVRNPWRIAYALLHQTRQVSDARLPHYRNALMESMLASAAHAPLTTSMGRLFDGIAAIILAHDASQEQFTLREESVQYEAQFAAELEAICDSSETGFYEMPLVSQRDASDRSRLHWDWRPMVQAICIDKQQGVAPPVLAMRFHRTLARAISELVMRFADYDVVLSGGVFQNRILVELIGQRLDAARCNVAWPGRVPVNDGGLAAGQLAVAMAILERETCA